MKTPDVLMNLVPQPIKPLLHKRGETVKFLIVGSTCFIITMAINYLLKLTVLRQKPVTALIIGTIVATVVSYILNREWSFRTRGGRRRHHEASLFVFVNIIGIGINATPEWITRYIFHLQEPYVSFRVQEISDFISGMVVGTALAMFFRLWAFRAWVFPHSHHSDSKENIDLTATSSATKSTNGSPPEARSIDQHMNLNYILPASRRRSDSQSSPSRYS